MHDVEQFVYGALALGGIHGQDWLRDIAIRAFHKGLSLEVDASDTSTDPQIIVRHADNRWLSISLNSDPEDIQSLVDNFGSRYEAMRAEIENPDVYYESKDLGVRIVDALIEGENAEEFLS